MKKPLRVLIVEDHEIDAGLLLRAISRGGYEVAYEVVDSPAAMRDALERREWDVTTSDHAMPNFNAPEALALAKELRPELPFIIVSGEIDLNLAVSLMKGGAQDYIQKRELVRLVPAIERELREVQVRREHRRVADALQVSETRYRRLFESARDGILILDAATRRINDVNPFMEELLGYTRDEFLQKELWEIGLLEDAEASQETFRNLQEKGYIRYENLPLRTKEGSAREVEFVSNIYVENGHEVIQCNIRSIAARKEAEAGVREINAELERRVRERTVQLEAVNKEQEAFNYSVSHDLRTPLRQIDGFVEALLEDYSGKLDVEVLQLIRNIGASTQRMNALIDALLALGRFSRDELEWQSVDLSALARQIASELQQSDRARQVEFVIGEDITTKGDARLLRTVLENLLSNAWKFTAQRVTARIEFDAAPRADGSVRYFVRDDGAGFDMAHIDKLFGAFQRLHSEREFPGSGIGLATVERIIHRHGGQVWAEGEVDKGATFSFTL
ncbi:MAG TPA: ATP-binding protein [Candidatus Acidoferrales bacterium]|jgi:PAS domain S-box-containing protein|nr:ATP-binding protein [Candidatus Acidoferrales bacterium]